MLYPPQAYLRFLSQLAFSPQGFLLSVHARECVFACVLMQMPTEARRGRFPPPPGTGVAGVCELSDVDEKELNSGLRKTN